MHVHYLLFWQVVQYHLNYRSFLHLKEHLHVPMSVCQLNRKRPLVFVCRWATTADLQIHLNVQYHCNMNDNLIYRLWWFIRIRTILRDTFWLSVAIEIFTSVYWDNCLLLKYLPVWKEYQFLFEIGFYYNYYLIDVRNYLNVLHFRWHCLNCL